LYRFDPTFYIAANTRSLAPHACRANTRLPTPAHARPRPKSAPKCSRRRPEGVPCAVSYQTMLWSRAPRRQRRCSPASPRLPTLAHACPHQHTHRSLSHHDASAAHSSSTRAQTPKQQAPPKHAAPPRLQCPSPPQMLPAPTNPASPLNSAEATPAHEESQSIFSSSTQPAQNAPSRAHQSPTTSALPTTIPQKTENIVLKKLKILRC
jgi:hypothetical protein